MGSKNDTPQSPTPEAQANAQIGVNADTALRNAILNNPNMRNMFGSSTWTMDNANLGGYTGYQQPAQSAAPAGALPGLDGGGVTFGGKPSGYNLGVPRASQPAASTATGAVGSATALPPQMTNTQTFSPEGQALYNQVFQNTAMPDSTALAAQAKGLEDQTYNTMLARLNPQFAEADAAFNNSMATRGIPVGGQLYDQQRALLDKSRNQSLMDLALSSAQVGREEQNRLFNLDLAGRNYQSGLLGQFTSNAPGSAYNGTAQSAPDVAGYMQNQYANQLNAANQSNASNASTLGTLGQLGGAYLGSSGLSGLLGSGAAGAGMTVGGQALGGALGSTVGGAAAGTAAGGGLLAGLGSFMPWLAGAGLLYSVLSD